MDTAIRQAQHWHHTVDSAEAFCRPEHNVGEKGYAALVKHISLTTTVGLMLACGALSNPAKSSHQVDHLTEQTAIISFGNRTGTHWGQQFVSNTDDDNFIPIDSENGDSLQSYVAEQSSIISELYDFGKLELDWDNDGAFPPLHNAITDAAAFIQTLPSNVYLPEPLPYADGSIGLLWDTPEIYLAIVFRGTGTISYYGTSQQHIRVSNDNVEITTAIPQEIINFLTA